MKKPRVSGANRQILFLNWASAIYKVMSFLSFILREMAHIQVDGPLKINGKDVSFIDMRFEKYMPPVSNSLLGKWLTGFTAKLPDGKGYMFFERGISPKIVADPPPNYLTVPHDWWDYAAIVYSDGSIKHPTKG